MEVFKSAPDKKRIIEVYVRRIIPMSWSGSRADKLRLRLGIFDDLASLASEEDMTIVDERRAYMLKLVNEIKEQEDAEERTKNETFE